MTRYNPNGDGKLQFAAIQRRDTGEWAIPGAFLDDSTELIPRKLMLLYGMNASDVPCEPQSPPRPVPRLQLLRTTSSSDDPAEQREGLVKELFASGNGTREHPSARLLPLQTPHCAHAPS